MSCKSALFRLLAGGSFTRGPTCGPTRAFGGIENWARGPALHVSAGLLLTCRKQRHCLNLSRPVLQCELHRRRALITTDHAAVGPRDHLNARATPGGDRCKEMPGGTACASLPT